MQHRRSISRRDLLKTLSAGTFAGSATSLNALRADRPRGVVHVVVFSNFEGKHIEPVPVIRWFDACTAVHRGVRWTHMYNPVYLLLDSPKMLQARAAFNPYLLNLQKSAAAEVGLHVHMYYDMVRQMGVEPRAYPYAGDKSAGCNDRRAVEQDRGNGYDVLLTGYTPVEQAMILDAGIQSFVNSGFGQPTSFCAGYSAANPELQALLVQKGFTTSFSAQVIPPNHYGSCWDKLLEWSGNITPLTVPYRVSRHSIVPPPHTSPEYLDLVEVPLNLNVDANELFVKKDRVTREAMFDRHVAWAQRTSRQTAVAIGVHAEVIAEERWGPGRISEVLDVFLRHVEQRAKEETVEVRFSTVSEVAKEFRENKTLREVSDE